jgi:two-component system chemotaxis sensor kinase CheA
MSMSDPAQLSGEMQDLISSWLADEPVLPTAGEPNEVVDPEIVESFVVECLDLLEEAEQAVLHLEAQPDDDCIDVIFRCFHTIKGTAAFLSLDHVSGIAHDAETLLERIRVHTTPLDAEVVNLLIRSIDVLAESARNAGAGRSAPDRVASLRRELQSATAGQSADSSRVVWTDSPAAPRSTLGTGHAAAHVESWTRVRTDRLDRLLEMVGELVVTQSMLAREAGLSADASSPISQLIATAGKNVRALQDLSVGMRLVPLRSLFRRMERIVHDLSRRSGKQVRIVTAGEETEIDRNLIEELIDPFLHMIRNAVDHGIEPAEERQALGKPAVATLELAAFHRGGNVVLQLKDDGRGLDTERVRAGAVERGWLSPERQPTESEILDFVFAPGFSTATSITEMSGRGVGLDVVRRNLQTLDGRIHVTTTQGSGCTFEVEVPLTLAITDGMLIRVGSEEYILPVGNMMYSLQPSPESLRTIAGRGEMIVLAEGILPLVRLRDRLGVPAEAEPPQRTVVVVVAAGGHRCALLIDQIVGQQQVVAKPLNGILGSRRGISGSAILGNGRVGLILDIPQLLDVVS